MRAHGPAALGLLLALATGAVAGDVPPAPDRYVTDRAGLLSAPELAALDERLETHARTTGQQVVVWIDRSLSGAPIEDWAERAFQAWRIGRRGLDDGVALFVFTEDRRARIEVGYGLEAVLTDVEAGAILDAHLVPGLRAGKGGSAIVETTNAILSAIRAGDTATPPGERSFFAEHPLLTIVGGILFLLLAIRHPWLAAFILTRGGRDRGRGGGFAGGGGRSGGGGASRPW